MKQPGTPIDTQALALAQGWGQVRRWFFSVRQWRLTYRWGGIAALAALGGVLAFVLSGGGTQLSRKQGSPSTIVVTPRPLVQRLSLVGTIFPGSVVNMVGPFHGAVKEKLVDYGMRVQQGQRLLVLDTSEIELRLREAEAALIKANREVEDLNAWGNTPDVIRARHAVVVEKAKLDDMRRKESESKELLSRGIIPRIEYDSVKEQLKSEEFQLSSAQQDLDTALDRGNAEHRRLAQLELETARKRLSELQRQMDAGVVEAPVSGLVLRPAASSGGGDSGPASIEVGSRIAAGQPMFTVANTDTLKVVARVDEIDVNRIGEGQAVEITGDAFGLGPIVGQVARISAQADSDSSGSAMSKSASFEVVVTIPVLSEEQRQHIRVGMSATLSIITYQNPNAIVVPVAGVHQEQPGNAFVVVRDGASGQDHPVPVVVGRSTEDGVEILGELKAGDVILAQEASANGVPAVPMRASGSGALSISPVH